MKFIQSNYTIREVTGSEVITLDQAKAFCKVETDDDDLVIQVMISAAILTCETITNRTLRSTTFLGEFDRLDNSRYERYPFLAIQRSPVQSVESVKMYDGTDFVDVDFKFMKKSGYSRVLFDDFQYYYDYFDTVPFPVQIEFSGGYSEVPAVLLNAIKAHVLFLYENRGDVTPDGKVNMPIEVEAMYRQHRVVGGF